MDLHPVAFGPAVQLASASGLFRVAYFPTTHTFGGITAAGWTYARMPFGDAARLVGEVRHKGLAFDAADVARWSDDVLRQLPEWRTDAP
ncbi:hypothetical protein E2F46_06155 [Luteimonas aestuarii]|uniref:Uncharacterized protein n=1 Tax=Luteimonas aestuarii TaxID=453837 RepID=A0A4R5TY76_9GAMM|nr:hypothetical protein [Luteimonas aestuarii]TDK26177.1 hypothetical protein E2F46_06155 [Luteimonas aestuarii]